MEAAAEQNRLYTILRKVCRSRWCWRASVLQKKHFALYSPTTRTDLRLLYLSFLRCLQPSHFESHLLSIQSEIMQHGNRRSNRSQQRHDVTVLIYDITVWRHHSSHTSVCVADNGVNCAEKMGKKHEKYQFCSDVWRKKNVRKVKAYISAKFFVLIYANFPLRQYFAIFCRSLRNVRRNTIEVNAYFSHPLKLLNTIIILLNFYPEFTRNASNARSLINTSELFDV